MWYASDSNLPIGNRTQIVGTGRGPLLDLARVPGIDDGAAGGVKPFLECRRGGNG